MLNDLDAVDWKSLTHAYGEATDVPELLRVLLSPDAKAREAAHYELSSSIWHQGTVYSATAAAVPFLYELLNAPDVPDKSSIACLLANIADGSGYLEANAVGDFLEPAWRTILKEQNKSLENELSREATETALVRRAASKDLMFLLPFLNDDEPEIRRCVALAFANYPEHASWSLPAIDAALTSEKDEDVRFALLASKERLGTHAE